MPETTVSVLRPIPMSTGLSPRSRRSVFQAVSSFIIAMAARTAPDHALPFHRSSLQVVTPVRKAEVVMNAMKLVIGEILPFVTLAVLVLGLGYRMRKWHKAAVANLAVYPAASNRTELWKKVLGEVLLFRSFRKEHAGLWWQTWPFHAAIALIVLGHTRLITDWPLRVLFGMSAESVDTFSAWAGWGGRRTLRTKSPPRRPPRSPSRSRRCT